MVAKIEAKLATENAKAFLNGRTATENCKKNTVKRDTSSGRRTTDGNMQHTDTINRSEKVATKKQIDKRGGMTYQ